MWSWQLDISSTHGSLDVVDDVMVVVVGTRVVFVDVTDVDFDGVAVVCGIVLSTQNPHDFEHSVLAVEDEG